MYHKTVTLAYLVLIDDRIDRTSGAETFDSFSEAHPDLRDRAMTPLLAHDCREVLFSPEAFARFVEPDLAPWPGLPGG